MSSRNRNTGWFGASSREKARRTEVELAERENNAEIDTLSDQVALLKAISQDLNRDVEEQNSFLDSMGSGFTGAGQAIGKTMTTLDTMSRSGGTRFAVLIIFGIVGTFILYWWASSHKKSQGDEIVPTDESSPLP